ncbi:hypothetical protein [Paraburkholderia sediminicola]|uniref:hypothetical protein n=1 Tax=Paraburkholderia sediminicola TaxID=458836 RepID=UPI0038BAD830
MAEALAEIVCLPEPFDGERLREVVQAFEGKPGLWDRVDASGGTKTVAETVFGHTFCRVLMDGAPVAFYVLYFYQGNEGTEAFVTAAHGRAKLDLCRVVLPLIERQCAGCSGVGMRTRRRGLVRKLGAAGYVTEHTQAGSVQMRKAL